MILLCSASRYCLDQSFILFRPIGTNHKYLSIYKNIFTENAVKIIACKFSNFVDNYIFTHTTSVGKCKKDVTPLLTHWSHVFLVPTNRLIYMYIYICVCVCLQRNCQRWNQISLLTSRNMNSLFRSPDLNYWSPDIGGFPSQMPSE